MSTHEITRDKVTSGSGSYGAPELNEIVISSPRDQTGLEEVFHRKRRPTLEMAGPEEDFRQRGRYSLAKYGLEENFREKRLDPLEKYGLEDDFRNRRRQPLDKDGFEHVLIKKLQPTPEMTGNVWKVKRQHKELCRAIWKGDWERAQCLVNDNPEYITARISPEGDTALHIVAGVDEFDRHKGSWFLEVLLGSMEKEDLEIKNNDGNTAFCLAAMNGNVGLAHDMLLKNPDLPTISGKNGTLPIYMAAQSGHKEMVKFLYYLTKFQSEEDLPAAGYRTRLFHTLITIGLYDSALGLLEKDPRLATARVEGDGETALHVLAMPTRSSNSVSQGILKRFFSLFSSGDKDRCSKLPPEALELVKQLWGKVKYLDEPQISEILDKPWQLLFVAAEKGNFEFLKIIISENHELCKKYDDKGRSFVDLAILNRQEDIFTLINEIPPPYKKALLKHKDKEGNNILHLAGMLAPSGWLNTITGVAFQLQEELLWFEKVREMMQPFDVEAKLNDEGKTPEALFTDKHEKLKEKGEKWIKQTANSCMIVATLIATVVFAAAFTVPGGTKDENGTPHFIQKASFTIFVISDAVSLVSSACSILSFLSILTSRYAEKDFLSALPRKLFLGLSTLLLSIAAMMVVFGATIFIVFKNGKIWVPILVSAIASLPVILFTMQQWRLLFDLARSTFKNSSIFRRYKLKNLIKDAFKGFHFWLLQSCLLPCCECLEECWPCNAFCNFLCQYID